ncbi:predicted protein [Chaetomium globosum CBS 148.51]|uniref:Velvet domain-containing protein n=1 Tax=Chaetomium globosum (strain ATCC 6205 / CBS 148.51 / DSM 1962 / NBRC 6347 / NRRL 1970) TaxID=306901 RepID=Q2H8D3_CHAGB|nr:uncharacterized protein CHGG_03521 [Chaetomium globosum CBS 148.51]EAQ91586.1 predicted protein [Chaetomium globosum CBS 148.51]
MPDQPEPNPTVTITVQPPHDVKKDSPITPKIRARLQFNAKNSLKNQVGSIYATAVVRDMDETAIANSDYSGKMETEYQSKKTVGDKTNVTYAFPELCVRKAGTFRITVSIHSMDGSGSVVLGEARSEAFTVYQRN